MKKTILITGSTDGIGKLTAIQLAKEGHEVLIHGRNMAKVKAVVTEIQSQSNNPNIKGFVADFSDLKAVQSLVEQLVASGRKLDVLINNAGVYKTPNVTNSNGLDMRFVVNYLAPYIFTTGLLPILNTNSRIVNLSSAAQGPVSLVTLKGEASIADNHSYAQSKLALTMWSFDLAKKLKDTTVIAVNPGSLLNTQMVSEAFGQHWSSADKGANILFDLAVSSEYEGITGKYFDNDLGEVKGGMGQAHSDAYDLEKINELIVTTESILQGVA